MLRMVARRAAHAALMVGWLAWEGLRAASRGFAKLPAGQVLGLGMGLQIVVWIACGLALQGATNHRLIADLALLEQRSVLLDMRLSVIDARLQLLLRRTDPYLSGKPGPD